MDKINDMLSQLHKILKCKMALHIEDTLYCYPTEDSLVLETKRIKDYKAWDIDADGSRVIFYCDENADISEQSIALANLYLKNQIISISMNSDYIINLITGNYGHTDIAFANKLIGNDKPLYLIAISCQEVSNIENELLEIIRNSVDVKYIAEYQGNLIALVEEYNVNEACSNLQKNILTELFVEPVISVGGRLEQAQQLTELHNNCIEAMLLKHNYGMSQKLLDYQSMILYRFISSIDQKLKADIVDRIFSSRFTELLNSEMELTIEEMFRNNLNLTDTAARLYIHRNTLLYRIDKIYKLTSFDLRKFEDSMIFKLAWLMYKEKINNNHGGNR